MPQSKETNPMKLQNRSLRNLLSIPRPCIQNRVLRLVLKLCRGKPRISGLRKTASVFIKALSQTNLVNTLKNVHVRNSWYEVGEVEQEFKKAGFSVVITGEHVFPEEMQE